MRPVSAAVAVPVALAFLCTAMATQRAPTLAGHAAKLRRLVTAPLTADDSLDVPGILWLEHLNLCVGDRAVAEAFYVDFLGFVPEPGGSWHVNLGAQQLHLASRPAGQEHVLTGCTGLAVPSLGVLRTRCERARKTLAGTSFDVADHSDCLSVVCPWGNRYVCYEASVDTGSSSSAGLHLPKMVTFHTGLDESMCVRGGPGIRYVEFRARAGTSARIGLFYEAMFACKVSRARRERFLKNFLPK